MNYKISQWGQSYHDLQTDEALGGGSAGPGKSLVLLMDANEQIAIEHARVFQTKEIDRSTGWAIHLRREFPRLEQTIHRSKLMFPKLDSGAKWDQQAHKWTFSSGYQYQFGHLKDNDSFLNYRSNEYSWLGIDEIGEIESKDIYDELSLRVRTTDKVLSKLLKVRSMSNPCGNWVRDYFVEPCPTGKRVLSKEIALSDGTKVKRTRVFLPAKLSDNPDPGFRLQYEASLRDRPAHIRASLLDGDWYVVAGAFFAELWDVSRVVIKPFKIPSGWRRFRSGDWGYKQNCVILWWAVSPDGEMICYRERTFNGPKAKELLDAHGVAQKIKEIELANGEWNKFRDCSRLSGFMDTQLWEERGHRGPTMADDMSRLGVYWQKATKGRKQAAQQLVKRLRQRGYNDRPGIMFFETCHQCLATIPALGTDESDPEVPKKGGPDHHYDAVSYAVAGNMLPSGKEDRSALDDVDERFEDRGAQVDRGQYGYG